MQGLLGRSSNAPEWYFLPSTVPALQNFSLIPDEELLKRTWDDQCVVYLTRSRETHLLNAPCAHLLEVLEQGSAPLKALQDRLQTFAGNVDGQEASDLTQEIVDTLSRMGIIETLEDAS